MRLYIAFKNLFSVLVFYLFFCCNKITWRFTIRVLLLGHVSSESHQTKLDQDKTSSIHMKAALTRTRLFLVFLPSLFLILTSWCCLTCVISFRCNIIYFTRILHLTHVLRVLYGDTERGSGREKKRERGGVREEDRGKSL